MRFPFKSKRTISAFAFEFMFAFLLTDTPARDLNKSTLEIPTNPRKATPPTADPTTVAVGNDFDDADGGGVVTGSMATTVGLETPSAAGSPFDSRLELSSLIKSPALTRCVTSAAALSPPTETAVPTSQPTASSLRRSVTSCTLVTCTDLL